MKMPRALEEKMHNFWISQLKEKEFKNEKVKSAFRKLNDWRMLSYALVDAFYKEQLPETYSGKHRLVFKNDFKYFPETPGEYLLLTKDLLSIFAKGKLPVFVGNFPIFVQLKNIPVFWINGGIITLWDFYFPVSKVETMFEEVARFSDKIAVFPRLEFTSFNFIQTYSSAPDQTVAFSTLQQKDPKLLELLEKYLTKNFWIIPETNIKDVNPFCFTFFEESTLLPCVPHRVIFKIMKVRRARIIYLLRRPIKCLEILISYFNSSGNIQTDVIYFPTKLFNVSLEKEKIYNGLLFTFVDFDREWLYPVLFSFYEEDLRSYEIFQELLLIFFKKRYSRARNFCSIDFDAEDFWDEINYVASFWWRKRMLPYSEDVFSRLGKETVLELLFSGLYPVLVNADNRIFHVPPPIGFLNLEKSKLTKLMEWSDAEKWGMSLPDYLEVGDIIPSLAAYREFVRNLRQKALFIKYIKQMIIQMGGSST